MDLSNIVNFVSRLTAGLPRVPALAAAKQCVDDTVSRVLAIETVFRMDRLGRAKGTNARVAFLSKSGARTFIYDQRALKASKRCAGGVGVVGGGGARALTRPRVVVRGRLRACARVGCKRTPPPLSRTGFPLPPPAWCLCMCCRSGSGPPKHGHMWIFTDVLVYGVITPDSEPLSAQQQAVTAGIVYVIHKVLSLASCRFAHVAEAPLGHCLQVVDSADGAVLKLALSDSEDETLFWVEELTRMAGEAAEARLRHPEDLVSLIATPAPPRAPPPVVPDLPPPPLRSGSFPALFPPEAASAPLAPVALVVGKPSGTQPGGGSRGGVDGDSHAHVPPPPHHHELAPSLSTSSGPRVQLSPAVLPGVPLPPSSPSTLGSFRVSNVSVLTGVAGAGADPVSPPSLALAPASPSPLPPALPIAAATTTASPTTGSAGTPSGPPPSSDAAPVAATPPLAAAADSGGDARRSSAAAPPPPPAALVRPPPPPPSGLAAQAAQAAAVVAAVGAGAAAGSGAAAGGGAGGGAGAPTARPTVARAVVRVEVETVSSDATSKPKDPEELERELAVERARLLKERIAARKLKMESRRGTAT